MTAGDRSKPPHFVPDDALTGTLYTDVGRRADRPFMILATFAETSLGDLISKITFISTLKDQFDHARLIVRYNNFRPYSQDVVSLSPNIDHSAAIRGELPRWLRRYVRDTRLWRPLSGSIKRSRRYHEAFYDMVITDSMANARMVHTFERTTPLKIPEQLVHGLTRQLVDLGLDQHTPFAVVHYRDGSYPLKGRVPVRNGDPKSYREAIDYIIDTLGCQVVQLGHPEMTPFPERSGLVDLSRLENSFMLQAFAVSRSRFMIGGASGPPTLGWSFNVPTAIADCPDAHAGWGSAMQLVLTPCVTTPDGRTLRNQALHEAGLLESRLLIKKLANGENYEIQKNTGEELSALATRLNDASKDVRTWREPADHPVASRPNALTWPPKSSYKMTFFDPS